MENELPLLHAGKVRRLYAWPSQPGEPGRLLMVATDNISAFDYVLDTQIPDKGKVLTQLSLWWFDQLRDLVQNHVISTDVPECLEGRAMITEELAMIPVECVARGYLTGSGWEEYQRSGSVCGIPLPEGLQDGSRLPEPIFTPAIKAEIGEHDENVDFDTIARLHGPLLAAALRDLTLALYRRAEEIARERGIILADTKFEFGARPDGTLVLADEVLTPDSSRFWDAATWQPGGAQPSFDKQYVRDWLAHESGWDKKSDTPPPALPEQVITATRNRYLEAYERLVGHPMAGFESVVNSVVESESVANSDCCCNGGAGQCESADVVPVSQAEVSTAPNVQTGPVSRVVVDVMPKPEILDPQGKAITGALKRLGFEGLSVRQGKRFEIEIAGDVTDEVLADIHKAAETLLANTVVETFTVHVEK